MNAELTAAISIMSINMLLNMLLKFRNLIYHALPEGKPSPGSHKRNLNGTSGSKQGYPEREISDSLQNM